MCGIAGFVHKNSCDEACLKIEEKIQELQECRGPDAHSTWSESKNGVTYHLYHQRLRIQDLSAAADQPMHSTTNIAAHIVFNGEIYNVAEISGKYLLNYMPHTHSDTEVLLEALSKHEVDKVLNSIRGMFAFGYLDVSDQKLILARDRFGEKPLHYWKNENLVFFSSQYNAVVESMKILGEEIEFDQDSIYEYLIYGYFPYHASLVKGVCKLAPGSKLTINFENILNLNVERWVSKWHSSKTEEMPFENLEKTLEEAIALQLIGDVPIGVFLSGGCDSTLVSAIAQKLNSRPIHSFSLGFENSTFDESKFALQAANEIGTNHHALIMTANDAAEILPAVLAAFPEPLGDPSTLPTTFISRETRKHVTVALTGDGADELFYGYGRYARFAELEQFKSSLKIPRYFVQPIKRLIGFLTKKLRSKAHRLIGFLSTDNPGISYANLVGFAHIKSVIDLDSFEKVLERTLTRLWNKGQSKEIVHRLREIDTDSYLADDILVKVDRAAMAYSLETRAPFLDPEVAQLAAKSNSKWLVECEQKHVIKVILEKYVSSEIYRRNKMGFGAPLGDWFRTSLKDWAESYVYSFNWEQVKVSSQFVKSNWQQILVKDDSNVTYIWILLLLASSVTNLKS